MFLHAPLIGTFINNAFTNPPFGRTVTLNLPSYTSLGGTEAPSGPPTLTTLGVPLKTPTVHQFSFGVEREIVRGHILNVAWVGSRGLRLMRPINLNDPEPGTLPSGTNVNFIRPYSGYGTITERQTSAGSVYHSLQVSFNRRLSKRLTAGHRLHLVEIDRRRIERSRRRRRAAEHRNTRAERGLSNFDRTHVFTGNFIYMLPAPVRSPFFRGWQISGIVRMWTGTPFDVTMSSDVAQIGATQNQRPDVIADGKAPARWRSGSTATPSRVRPPARSATWAATACAAPASTSGTWRCSRTSSSAERKRLQFRGEFFNAFNHPSFTTVGTTLNTTTAGVNPLINNFAVITGTRDARVAQIALKLYF